MSKRSFSLKRRRSSALVAVAALVALVCTIVMPGASTGSAAYWGDTSKVTASPVQLGGLPVAPKQASGTGLACSVSNGTLPRTITFSWARADGNGDAHLPQQYSAKAYVRTSSNGARTELPVVVETQSGSNDLRVRLTDSSSSGLIGLLLDLLGNLLGSTSYIDIEVTASYEFSEEWKSTTTHTGAKYTVLLLNLGASFSCN